MIDFACGDKFIQFIKIRVSSSKKFKVVSYSSCLVKTATHDSLVKDVNRDFLFENLVHDSLVSQMTPSYTTFLLGYTFCYY